MRSKKERDDNMTNSHTDLVEAFLDARIFQCPNPTCAELKPHRHLAKVSLAEHRLRYMFSPALPGHYCRIERGVPADAKFLTMCFDVERMCIDLYWEHPAFPIVLEGQSVDVVIPITEVSLTLR